MNKIYLCTLFIILSPLFSEVTLEDLKDTTVWQVQHDGSLSIYNRRDLRRVPILCFHIIGDEPRYEITAENFSRFLKYLNKNNFWLISDKEFLSKDLSSVPTGYKPIVLGSDDAAEGNFLYKSAGNLSSGKIDLNKPEILEDTMVEILERHIKPRDGRIPFTFYVSFNGLPFRQNGGVTIKGNNMDIPVVKHKFNYILDHFILGNHTFSHPVTKLSTAADFKSELDKFYTVMESYIGERVMEIDTLAYPHGCAELKQEMREMLQRYSYKGVQISGGFDFDGYFSTSPYSEKLDRLDVSRLGVDNKNIDRVYGWLESVPLHISERVIVVDHNKDLKGFDYYSNDRIIIRGDV